MNKQQEAWVKLLRSYMEEEEWFDSLAARGVALGKPGIDELLLMGGFIEEDFLTEQYNTVAEGAWSPNAKKIIINFTNQERKAIRIEGGRTIYGDVTTHHISYTSKPCPRLSRILLYSHYPLLCGTRVFDPSPGKAIVYMTWTEEVSLYLNMESLMLGYKTTLLSGIRMGMENQVSYAAKNSTIKGADPEKLYLEFLKSPLWKSLKKEL